MVDEVIVGLTRTKVLLDIEVNECEVEQKVYLDSYDGPLRNSRDSTGAKR
jgi:hypothetical protein